jgi:hypothetical protein
MVNKRFFGKAGGSISLALLFAGRGIGGLQPPFLIEKRRCEVSAMVRGCCRKFERREYAESPLTRNSRFAQISTSPRKGVARAGRGEESHQAAFTPETDRARHAGTAKAAIAGWILGKMVLMIIGEMEFACGAISVVMAPRGLRQRCRRSGQARARRCQSRE